MVHDFIVHVYYIFSIQCFYGLLYKIFLLKIMINYIDHNLYFHGLMLLDSSKLCKNNGSLSIHYFYQLG